MSLRISVSCSGADGKLEKISLEPGKHLAGFEESRYDFWGADVMKRLGLKLLPQLKEGYNIHATVESLNQLAEDARIIQENLTLILEETPYDRQFILGHTDNILHAVEIARDMGGEVNIG